jgi:hypothetical protein
MSSSLIAATNANGSSQSLINQNNAIAIMATASHIMFFYVFICNIIRFYRSCCQSWQ